MQEKYKRQADLMLSLLPHVAKENFFALKGGTAINFFVRDMPRISVDIDLTYIFIDDRETALQNISDALDRIETSIKKVIQGISITRIPPDQGHDVKLNCQTRNAHLKIEVNTTTRGILSPVRMMAVTNNVQSTFRKFAAINVVSHGELFGGKICAALDRQHPRDLFDIHYLLRNKEYNDEVKNGFIMFLLCHFRPMHELLHPHLLDQSETFDRQFAGMTIDSFNYKVCEKARIALVEQINTSLTKKDKAFLISFNNAEPDWLLFSLKGAESLPGVKWKLQNIQNLKQANPKKHSQLVESLQATL